MELMKIGSVMYGVHKKYPDENLSNGEVKICKVKTYRNVNGKIVPVLVLVGSKNEVDPEMHYFYKDLDKAVEAITTKKKKPKKKIRR